MTIKSFGSKKTSKSELLDYKYLFTKLRFCFCFTNFGSFNCRIQIIFTTAKMIIFANKKR